MEKIPSPEELRNIDNQLIKQWYAEHVNPTVATLLKLVGFDRRFVSASGPYVFDEKGNCYLDLLSGYGSLNLGHNHPEVLAAVADVIGAPVFLQASINPYAAALAKVLAQITPGDLKITFFCNSGAEAVEAALKIARAATGKPAFVYAENSFHGKTLGALSVTGRSKYREPFEPLLKGYQVPFGDSRELEKTLEKHNDIAAFIVEPVQGEAGVIIPPEGYLKEAEEICRRHNVLFIADEIQTGFGRTGRMFAVEHEGVVPDIICLAKSLGGGVMPIGAMVASERVWKRAYAGPDRCLLHTSTFGGNSLACAAGLAAVKVLVEQNLSERAAKLGSWFISRLKSELLKHRLVKDVRGMGLMIGIEFEPYRGILSTLTAGRLSALSREYTAHLIASELLEEHRIITAYTLNNPNVIRIQAPLIIDRADLEYAANALGEAVRGKSFIRLAALRALKLFGR